MLMLLLSACGGGGSGGGPDASPASSQSPVMGGFPALSQLPSNNQEMDSCASIPFPDSSNLIGSVFYERRPMAARSGLEDSLLLQPARGIVVEAVAVEDGSCTQRVVATTLSDGEGNYGFVLSDNVEVCIQVRAQLYRDNNNGGSGWDIQVTDNTRDNAPYYLLDNSPATVTAAPVRDLVAGSGWDGSDYSSSRAAAPFAILDTLCEGVDVLVNPLDGLESGGALPALNVRWSVNNTPVAGDLALGEVETAFFRRSLGVNEIVLRGDQDVNSDEYDPHVILHEFAHYIFLSFLRSDSLGGRHALSELLDLTTAFEEGWANAFAAIVLDGRMTNHNEALFRDSVGVNGSSAGGFWLNRRENFEAGPGWFTEGTVHRFIYDLYDTENSFFDQVTLPLADIYLALKQQVNSNALTSVFTFITALEDQNLVSEGDITRLLSLEDINGRGDYGLGESNDGGNRDALPIYTPLVDGQTHTLCSNNDAGVVNRLGNYRYLQFTASMERDYVFSVEVTGASGEDDGVATLDILQQGDFFGESAVASAPGKTLSASYQLPEGGYVIALSHYDNIIPDGNAPGRKCFEISVN